MNTGISDDGGVRNSKLTTSRMTPLLIRTIRRLMFAVAAATFSSDTVADVLKNSGEKAFSLHELLSAINDKERLDALPKECIPPIIAELCKDRDPNESQPVANQLIALLADRFTRFEGVLEPGIRRAAIEALVTQCESTDPRRVHVTFAVIRNIRDPRLLNVAEKRLQSSDPLIKEAAKRYLSATPNAPTKDLQKAAKN